MQVIPHSSYPARHAVAYGDSGFDVVHRNRTYGPFRIEWALDLYAIELHYRHAHVATLGQSTSLYADLSETGLPTRVCEIAIIVFAAAHEGIRLGMDPCDQRSLVANTLADHGLERFALTERRQRMS